MGSIKSSCGKSGTHFWRGSLTASSFPGSVRVLSCQYLFRRWLEVWCANSQPLGKCGHAVVPKECWLLGYLAQWSLIEIDDLTSRNIGKYLDWLEGPDGRYVVVTNLARGPMRVSRMLDKRESPSVYQFCCKVYSCS